MAVWLNSVKGTEAANSKVDPVWRSRGKVAIAGFGETPRNIVNTDSNPSR